MRYSIWGREHDADHDVELAQVENNPEAVLRGLQEKSLTIRGAHYSKRFKIPKYSWLRIVDNQK